MRIMALDVGSRTIGIACSDALLMTAQGIETIRRTSLENDFKRLSELITEYEVQSSTMRRYRRYGLYRWSNGQGRGS